MANYKLGKLLQEGLENEYIAKEEYDAMLGSNMNPGQFYSIFKAHKEHKEGDLPPVMPIVSGCGSMLENAGVFVEHHIMNHATNHESFI